MEPQGQTSEIHGMWTVFSAERVGSPISQFVNARLVFRQDNKPIALGRCVKIVR